MHFNPPLITQRTHPHAIIPLHASASSSTRDPVSATLYSHTQRVPLQRQHCTLEKERYVPQTHNGNATSTTEECDLCIRRNAVLLQDIHLHQGGLTHAHWHLPCQDCPQLRSAAFPHYNTLKHNKTYTPTPTTIPKSLLEHVLLPLILQRGLGLVGRSDGPSRNGGGRKGGGAAVVMILP